MARRTRPRLAVWKFASCDGCQLSLLDCEDELLAVAEALDIAYFAEASRRMLRGPYDLSLVEGSITTSADATRILKVRRLSRHLVTIGACATAGGIQALRNFSDVREFAAAVYPHPEYVKTLATSTPISAHVPVDFELRGCPIDKGQLLEVIKALPLRAQAGDCQTQRLSRMQTARHCLRHGRTWHPLSRSCNANRLRCNLSGLWARLLWLLRTC